MRIRSALRRLAPFVVVPCCLLPASSGKAAEETAPKPRPFFAFCMDVHDAKKRTLQEQAELLAEVGFDGAGHLWLENVPERLETLDQAGLKLFQVYVRVSVAPGKPPYDPKLKEVVPLLKGRGTMLAILITGLPPSDTSGDDRAVAIVREIADMASPAGVRVALYPHTNFWLERVEDGVRVAKKAQRENVGVMFNLCHWLKVDDEKNMRPLLEAAAPHLFVVSINGADPAGKSDKDWNRLIQPLDQGTFDLAGFLKTLDELGYAGPIGLMCYGLGGDARVHLTRSMAAWRRLVNPRN